VVLHPCRLAAQVGGLVRARFSMNGVCGSGSSTYSDKDPALDPRLRI
jgi:hypothetical protein